MWQKIIYYTSLFCIILLILLLSALLVVMIIHYYALYKTFDRYGIRTSWSLLRYFNKMCENHIMHDYKIRAAHRGDRLHGRFEFNEPVIILQDAMFIKLMTSRYFESFQNRTSIEFEPGLEPFKASSMYNMKVEDWKRIRPKLCLGFSAYRVKQMVPLIAKSAEESMTTLRELYDDNRHHQIEILNLSYCMVNEVITATIFGNSDEAPGAKNNNFYIYGNIIADVKINPKFINPFVNNDNPVYGADPDGPIGMEDALRFFTVKVRDGMRFREIHRTDYVDMLQFYTDLKNGKLHYHDTHSRSNSNSARTLNVRNDPSGSASTSRSASPSENSRERRVEKDLAEERADRREFGYAAVSNVTYESDTQPGETENQQRWTYNDFALQAGSIYVDGYKPVAKAVAFVLHELALNPECQHRLVVEIASQNMHNGEIITFETLTDMPYMDLVVSETLRKWPPIPYIKRVCTDPTFDLRNPRSSFQPHYMAQKGQTVWVPTFAIHRDPYFYNYPDNFVPERFNTHTFGRQQILGYNPFGTGVRNCIGSKLALVQIKVLLYYFLLSFEVVLSSRTSRSSKPCPYSSDLRLRGGHWLKIKKRCIREVRL